MAKKIAYFRKKVINNLKAANKYKPGAELSIEAAAVSWMLLDKAVKDLEGVEHCVYSEKTAYGTRIQKNPAYDLAKSLMETMLKSAKALGLHSVDLGEDIEEDPMVRLTADVLKAQKSNAGATVFPEDGV